jgi:hypothetical protein
METRQERVLPPDSPMARAQAIPPRGLRYMDRCEAHQAAIRSKNTVEWQYNRKSYLLISTFSTIGVYF